MAAQDGFEFKEEVDAELDPAQTRAFSEAVLHSADWTVETIVAQLAKGNIELNPRFQRRDAWSSRRKSLFIESLILGLPVPQIVLAEKQGHRGRYIVLDGKQRLLSLLQFAGLADPEAPNNSFRLSGLEARADLTRKSYRDLTDDPALDADLNAFSNYTIRTVVIRNWPSFDFLHLVFLRLNTGSVKLSPQELRQALFPGAFSDAADDAAGDSPILRTLLSRTSPDPRMRDVELLVRYLAFLMFLPAYAGRMKDFLDSACGTLNAEWDERSASVRAAIQRFEEAGTLLIEVFGANSIARKAGSRSFNRAIFDALLFYAVDERIADAMAADPQGVRELYARVLEDAAFLDAIDSDTAGVPHTLDRLRIWGEALRQHLALDFRIPEPAVIELGDGRTRAGITFDGFWAD